MAARMYSPRPRWAAYASPARRARARTTSASASKSQKGTAMPDHLIGLLLGAEEDWPQAFEAILDRVGKVELADGTSHTFRSERLTIEPFDLMDPVRTELVI